jgi:hypothetical protein
LLRRQGHGGAKDKAALNLLGGSLQTNHEDLEDLKEFIYVFLFEVFEVFVVIISSEPVAERETDVIMEKDNGKWQAKGLTNQ